MFVNGKMFVNGECLLMVIMFVNRECLLMVNKIVLLH